MTAEQSADIIARATLHILVSFHKGDGPFVFGINGRLTSGGLEDIESQLQEHEDEAPEGLFSKGDGDYLLKASYNSAQTDECGRVELPEYWELDLVEFTKVTYV